MADESSLLGLKEQTAMGIGGMIGGGIFSVLGLAINISGNAAPLVFLMAGVVALAAGYSYIRLALAYRSDGASFTYLEHAFPHWPNLAGILGWIVTVGYIGTLALYAYTFGIYAADLLGFPYSEFLRAILSIFILSFFMGINLLGAHETGVSEDLVVYGKIILLFFLAVVGFFSINTDNYIPFFNKGKTSLFAAAAITFVAYEGFQLITNGVCETKNPSTTIPKSIYLSIVIVTLIYVLLALMSIGNLVEADFIKHGEYALAIAVMPSLGKLGRVLVDIAALLATSSAINATLFGSARMAAEISTEKMMPKSFSFRNKTNVPWVALVCITCLALIFSTMAELELIATFASLTFLLVCIGVAIANIKLHKKTQCNRPVAVMGLIFMLAATLVLIHHLAVNERKIALFVIAVYIGIAFLELIVSKRRII